MRIQTITSEDTIALRHVVLWPEKDIAYVCLPEDDQGRHFGAFVAEKDTPICIISLFIEPLPAVDHSPIDDAYQKAVRFRKFACDPAYQQRMCTPLS